MCPPQPTMQTRLWQKLFLAFAALSVAALLALYLLQQRAFQRDFLDYTNRISIGRLEAGAVQIGRRYAQVGDWSFLVRQPRVFENLLDGGDGRPRGGQRDDRPPRDERPPREDGPPPRDDLRPPRERPPVQRDAEAPNRPPVDRPPAKRRIDALNFNSRVALLDTEGRLVIGNPNVPRDSPSIAVKSEGVVVGSLLLAPLPDLQNDADVAFAAAQTRHALVAAIGVLIGALLAAWALARWLLKPVKALSAGSQQLAAGDYSVRIDADRRDELGELADDFNHLAAALEENQQARRQWGADIAHELRTPLSILRGEIQALQDGVRPLEPAALASLQAECARITSLVEDLYQLSLSDAGALEYKFVPLNLAALLESMVGEYRGAFESAGLTVSLAPLPATPPMVNGDERRLSQLFANLLTNAMRYTDAPGNVQVELASAAGGWRITIDDTPPGVAPHHLPKLFDRLYRVEASRNRNAGGAGLGLAICRNIVGAHKGRIDAGASPLGGLRITIDLPARKPAA